MKKGKNYFLFGIVVIAIIVIFLVVANWSYKDSGNKEVDEHGCSISDGLEWCELKQECKNSDECSMSIEEGGAIATDYILDSHQFKDYGGSNPRLIGNNYLGCEYCWEFVYAFDVDKEKFPSVIRYQMTVAIRNGQVAEVHGKEIR